MSRYLPLSGQVTGIAEFSMGQPASCTLLLTLQGINGEQNQLILSPDVFVYNQEPIRAGDYITAFYDATAPMPLIYPPRYPAAAAVKTFAGQSAALDVFDENLVNSSRTLKLNPDASTVPLS